VVQLGAGDGDAGRRVERLTPIHVLEYKFRQQGVFLLVDVGGKKLWFHRYGKDHAVIHQMMELLKGRTDEMVKFLTARARVPRGETK
jgi:hypothetical protein